MAEPAASQLMLFVYTILTGLLAGVIYDVYAGAGYVFKLRKMAMHAGDMLFWLVLTALVYAMLWYCNRGEVRFFVLLGLGIGAGLYHYFCRRTVKKTVILCLEQLIRFLRRFWRIFTWLLAVLFFPFRVFFMVLAFPFRLAGGIPAKAIMVAGALFKKTAPAPVKKFYRRQAARWREIKRALKRKK